MTAWVKQMRLRNSLLLASVVEGREISKISDALKILFYGLNNVYYTDPKTTREKARGETAAGGGNGS